jgi:hypothetical protein
MRPPREPWVNPAKRAQLIAMSAVLAFVLLFGGLAVGFAVGHHRAERQLDSRFEGGYGPLQGPLRGPAGAHPRYAPNPGHGPNERKVPFPTPGSPSPTATKSS